VARRPITTPWTPELDERLKLLAAQKATAIRASAALNKPINSVRTRARTLGLSFSGVREMKAKIRALAEAQADIRRPRIFLPS
jgi:hypothetical protein